MKMQISKMLLLGALEAVFGLGVAGMSGAQESARPAKGFAGCIQPAKQDGSLSLSFRNSCSQNMQFTISWNGTHPTQKRTYYIGGAGIRQVNKVDKDWVFSGEAPATFDGGGKGDVLVLERATPVQDLYRLFFHNNHANYALADVVIALHFLPPTSGIATIHRQVVLDPRGDYSCCFFDKTVFAKYEVSAVKAEDDPE